MPFLWQQGGGGQQKACMQGGGLLQIGSELHCYTWGQEAGIYGAGIIIYGWEHEGSDGKQWM